MRVALVSLDQRWQDKPANLVRCADFAAAAKAEGCGLAIFPEMTLTGYSMDVAAIMEPLEASRSLADMGRVAAQAGIDLVFGACHGDGAGGRARNTLCLARGDSSAEVVYAKIHPFSFAGEDKVLDAGETLACRTAGGLTFGCTICYDLRFPEIYAVLSGDCQAIVNIANWPARRVAHWRALLVARAIENQLFVLGVNRIGTDGNGLSYEKSSLVVAPDGTLLAPVFASLEMDIFEIDPAESLRYREAFPIVRDKRWDLYRKFYEGKG
jgi:omega-amidase